MPIAIIMHNFNDRLCLFCKLLQTWLFKIARMKDPREAVVVEKRKYDLHSEILAWRKELRRERYVHTITCT